MDWMVFCMDAITNLVTNALWIFMDSARVLRFMKFRQLQHQFQFQNVTGIMMILVLEISIVQLVNLLSLATPAAIVVVVMLAQPIAFS